jgi:ribosome-associated protein
MQTPSEIPAIKEVKETKPRAKKADASADAPKRSRKKAEAQAVLETVAAKKPRARKVAEPESVEVVDDSASDTPVKKPRARKAVGDAPAVAVPAGKRIKVATSKVVETELKEIKAAKTRTRKAAEAAPAPRVMKRTVKAKPE